MLKFAVHKLINEETRLGLLEVAKVADSHYHDVQDDDLGVKVRTINIKKNNLLLEKINQFVAKMDPDLYLGECFFNLYKEGSYIKGHMDGGQVRKTVVTVIHKSEDLKGGYALFLDRENECPYVLDVDIGESIVYDQTAYHALSYIYQGSRLALVCWYHRKSENKV